MNKMLTAYGPPELSSPSGLSKDSLTPAPLAESPRAHAIVVPPELLQHSDPLGDFFLSFPSNGEYLDAFLALFLLKKYPC
jgi:hypothetical protein